MATTAEPVTRIVGDYADEVVKDSKREFSEQVTQRATFATHWEEVSELIDPVSRNTFQYGNWNYPGQKKTDRQVDATGMMHLRQFAAIMNSLLTPRNQQWHGLIAEDDDLADDRSTKLWLEQVVRIMFKYRYQHVANFESQNVMQFTQLGAYGTGGMFIDQAVDANGNPLKALRYKQLPLGELFLRENHQGLIDGFTRWYRMNGMQAARKFGYYNLPEGLQGACDAMSYQPFDFLHRVVPRQDYDERKVLSPQGKQFASYHISLTGDALLGEGGYYTFPLAASRYIQIAGEVYGRSPGMDVLPCLKTLNTEKRTFLKQGHRAGDPVILTSDDGLIDGVDLRPGAMNKGGMTADGKRLVDVLPVGDINITEKMMDEERKLSGTAFLVSLFEILTETPTMTATQVIERVNEKGILIAPVVGRQDAEYTGPLTNREMDLLGRMGCLPRPPLQFARRVRSWPGGVAATSTNPLSRIARAQEASGFMRTLEVANQVSQALGGDPSVYDPFDFETAIPEIGEIQGSPTRWMATKEKIAAKQQARTEAAKRQQAIQAAPAAAAMLKAHIAAQQAGVDTSQLGGQPAPGGQPGQAPGP